MTSLNTITRDLHDSKSIDISLLCIFMAINLFFPTSMNLLKGTLLGLVLFIAIWRGAMKNIEWIIPIIFYVTYNLFSTFHGLVLSAPGALRTLTVSAIYPFIFSYLFVSFSKTSDIKSICKTIIVIGTFIASYDAMYSISNMLGFSLPNWFEFESLDYSYSEYAGYSHFTSRHINCLYFTVPLTFALQISSDSDKILSRKFLLTSLIIQLGCALLSSRMALVALSIVSPIVVLLGYRLSIGDRDIQNIKKPRGANVKMLLISMIVLTSVVIWQWDRISPVLNDLVAKVSIEQNSGSNAVRAEERRALLNGWASSPIIGYGAGASCPEYIRDPDMPWAYEVSYYALLYQRGIIGFLVYFSFYGYILSGCIGFSKSNPSLSAIGVGCFAGLTIFLMANSVDPYLGKFGYMWVLFFPFALRYHKRIKLVLLHIIMPSSRSPITF